MDVEAVADLAWPPADVFAEVRDLGGYPAWLGIVQSADPADQDGDSGPAAWSVVVGARLGPVGRNKRARMVRVADEAPTLARFERAEADGRSHSPWVLTARIEPATEPAAHSAVGRSRLTMHLHYGGQGWLPLAELALRQEIRRAGPRLAARLAAR